MLSEEWRNDGMGVSFAQKALDRYQRDGTVLFQISSIAKLPQFVALLRAINGGGADPRRVRSGDEKVPEVVLVEADEEDWKLDRVMNAA